MPDPIQLSDEQRRIVDHPVGRNGRVLAGPGSGKSFTATALLARLIDSDAPPRAKMLTFTRAATAEFAGKLADAELADEVERPSTVHSHALAVLMGMEGHGLPEPLRIVDSWETAWLVHPYLSRTLKAHGFATATPGLVKKLEGEMAAGWEKLDESLVLLSELDPALRTAYVAAWQEHRAVFGYSLLAELPSRAARALEDKGEDYPPRLDLLIVDEYQDLNAADIAFVAAHAALNVSVLAIGDDDQSIYGWRQAHPAGIRDFCDDFHPSDDYTLTVSRRCGSTILAAANELIESAPGRLRRPSLSSTPEAPEGTFAHVRFRTGAAEVAGVAEIATRRIACGVDPADILVLVRSNVDRWRNELEPALASHGVPLSSTDWVDDALADRRLRAGIALGRLRDDPEDSLAWWTLTQGLTTGLGDTFTDYVYDARPGGGRWGHTLLELHRSGYTGLRRSAAARCGATVTSVLTRLAEPDAPMDPDDETGWGGWLIAELEGAPWAGTLVPAPLSADAERLLRLVGPQVDVTEKLSALLNALEPVGRDLAAMEAGGVRLMTMARSKGLTVNTAVVMGVEEGNLPLGGADVDEERRLLYVAMTRATEMCVLTSAARRTGPLARHGGGRAVAQRGRCTLLEHLTYSRPKDGPSFVASI